MTRVLQTRSNRASILQTRVRYRDGHAGHFRAAAFAPKTFKSLSSNFETAHDFRRMNPAN